MDDKKELEELISILKTVGGKIKSDIWIDNDPYRAKLSIRHWKNPFTKKSGHVIHITLDSEDV